MRHSQHGRFRMGLPAAAPAKLQALIAKPISRPVTASLARGRELLKQHKQQKAATNRKSAVDFKLAELRRRLTALKAEVAAASRPATSAVETRRARLRLAESE
jgi:small-conductance mechanosensitive channel